MLFSAFRRTAAQGARRVGTAARPISTAAGNNVYRTLYQNVFKSNIAYLTYVFAGAIALEWVYSKGIDTAWEISNSGKLYHQIDWAKWKFHLDEDEEEEEEEEEQQGRLVIAAVMRSMEEE